MKKNHAKYVVMMLCLLCMGLSLIEKNATGISGWATAFILAYELYFRNKHL